jgi:hypothetical protein
MFISKIAYRLLLSIGGNKMKKCNICGKENSANNLTWSNEMLCDDCVNWIDNFQHNENNMVYDLLTNVNFSDYSKPIYDAEQE